MKTTVEWKFSFEEHDGLLMSKIKAAQIWIPRYPIRKLPLILRIEAELILQRLVGAHLCWYAFHFTSFNLNCHSVRNKVKLWKSNPKSKQHVTAPIKESYLTGMVRVQAISYAVKTIRVRTTTPVNMMKEVNNYVCHSNDVVKSC